MTTYTVRTPVKPGAKDVFHIAGNIKLLGFFRHLGYCAHQKKFVGRQKKNVVRQSADEIDVNRLVEKATTANVDKTFIRATCRADLLADKSLSVSSPLYHTAARHRRNPNRKALL